LCDDVAPLVNASVTERNRRSCVDERVCFFSRHPRVLGSSTP
jgi:hypothetical protein